MNRQERRAAAKSGQQANGARSHTASDPRFNVAVAHYQAGRLSEAEKCCRQILESTPQNADAMHMLGALCIKAGQYDAAIGWVSQAIRLNNRNPNFFVTLAGVLQERGKLNEALECYRFAIELKPDWIDVLFLRARVLQKIGSREKAIEQLDKILALQPGHLDAHRSLVVVLHESGRTEDALAACDRALSRFPNVSGLYNNRGIILKALGRFDEALVAYERAIETSSSGDFLPFNNSVDILKQTGRLAEALAICDRGLSVSPNSAELLNCKGVVLADLDRVDEALTCYNEAIERHPNSADAFSNRAKIGLRQQQHARAIEDCDRAIALNPSLPEAFHTRGRALRDTKKLAEAARHLERAIELRPDFFQAIVDLGAVLHRLNRFEEALAQYDRVIAINPEFAEGFQDRAITLLDLARYEEALRDFEKAISLNPDLANAHWNEGIARLLTGDLKVGWEKSEWRWKAEETLKSYRQFSQPMWMGEPLEDKTIFVHNEQGVGDAIQFARYIPMLVAKGAKVILGVDRSLISILSGIQGVTVVSPDEQSFQFDFHCPLLSLPLGFGTTLETIPNKPYLPQPVLSGRWDKILTPKTKPRVGIAWSGSTIHPNDHNRSIPLDTFMGALEGVDATFVSLQKDVRPRDSDILKSHREILDLREELASFTETSELIAELDLVISVDTSVAHLVGALQRPVWILLPYVPDWRWLLNRDDSPWYPTARLFRQTESRDWKAVLNRVNEALTRSDLGPVLPGYS